MTLSVREKDKLSLASRTALQTFREQAEKDGVIAWQINMDPSYLESAYEVAEHLTLEAIRQSETKKVEVLGHYYGSQFYKGNTDWQDMHQIITMAGTLTYRQMVLIRLICDGFDGISQELFITNPSACVEINRMQDYGLWMTDMAMFKDDSSAKIQIKLLKPTGYAKMVYDALMMEKLLDDDIKRTIESLAISEEGEPAEGITKEDFEAATTWNYDEKDERLALGRYQAVREAANMPEDMTFMMRGKDFIRDASRADDGGNMMKAIDCVMNALEEYKKCKSETLRQPAIDDALKNLIDYFGQCQEYGELRILKGKRQDYETILKDIKSEYLPICQDYLGKANEKDEQYDKDYHLKAIDEIFEV